MNNDRPYKLIYCTLDDDPMHLVLSDDKNTFCLPTDVLKAAGSVDAMIAAKRLMEMFP